MNLTKRWRSAASDRDPNTPHLPAALQYAMTPSLIFTGEINARTAGGAVALKSVLVALLTQRS